MKAAIKNLFTQKTHVSLCSEQSIVIGGRTLTPDPDRAYCDFSLSYAFPARTDYKTAIHPQVVANSYASLQDKVFNLAHLMRKYDPKKNPRDRILGLVVAVEFPQAPALCACGHEFDFSQAATIVDATADKQGPLAKACPKCSEAVMESAMVWRVQADPSKAPGIRAVAAMIKSAEGFDEIYASWQRKETPWGGEWNVSMENDHHLETSGFVVRGSKGLEAFVDTTPADIRALGYTYVSCKAAPLDLLRCVNDERDDEADGIVSTRIKRDFMGQDVTLLCEGLNGVLRYKGVGLAPNVMEQSARVSQMLAASEFIDVAGLFAPLHALADRFIQK